MVGIAYQQIYQMFTKYLTLKWKIIDQSNIFLKKTPSKTTDFLFQYFEKKSQTILE